MTKRVLFQTSRRYRLPAILLLLAMVMVILSACADEGPNIQEREAAERTRQASVPTVDMMPIDLIITEEPGVPIPPTATRTPTPLPTETPLPVVEPTAEPVTETDTEVTTTEPETDAPAVDTSAVAVDLLTALGAGDKTRIGELVCFTYRPQLNSSAMLGRNLSQIECEPVEGTTSTLCTFTEGNNPMTVTFTRNADGVICGDLGFKRAQ